MGLDYVGSFIHRFFFSINTVTLSVSTGFASIDPTNHRLNFNPRLVESVDVEPWTQRVDSGAPFYMSDLSILGFWYPWGSRNHSPAHTNG